MNIQLVKATAPDGREAVGAVLTDQAVMEPKALCQFLKQTFPEVYRDVWYAIEIPKHANGSRITTEG